LKVIENNKFGGSLLNYILIKNKIAIKIFLNLLFSRIVNIKYRVDKNYFDINSVSFTFIRNQ